MATTEDNFIPELETSSLPEENSFERLKRFGLLGCDSGQYTEVLPFYPRHVLTNSTLLLRAIEDEQQYGDRFEKICQHAKESGTGSTMRVDKAMLDSAVAWGQEILGELPHGVVTTQVDPRLTTADGMVACAIGITSAYAAHGYSKDRVLVGIPSTLEGFKACRMLAQEHGIHVNATLCFSVEQAAFAAEMRATVVSTPVGCVSDFRMKKAGATEFEPGEDPGVNLARDIWRYLRAWKYPTKVLAASFRSLDQAFQLVGCDIVCLSLGLLKTAAKTSGSAVVRTLFPDPQPPCDRIDVKAADWKIPEEAKELLDEGLLRFAKDAEKLEQYAIQVISS